MWGMTCDEYKLLKFLSLFCADAILKILVYGRNIERHASKEKQFLIRSLALFFLTNTVRKNLTVGLSTGSSFLRTDLRRKGYALLPYYSQPHLISYQW